jgi:hypothetical protein
VDVPDEAVLRAAGAVARDEGVDVGAVARVGQRQGVGERQVGVPVRVEALEGLDRDRLAVIPTQTSPLSRNCRCDSAQPMLRSYRLDGLSISTTTLPLKASRLAGRRTSTRVV